MIASAMRVVEQQAANAGVALICPDSENPTRIRGDRQRLEQALLNLLSNAIKFTPGGHVDVGVQQDAKGIQIAVEDTGIGIAERDISRILEPFVQADNRLARKYEGSGLGLAITRRLVELHGGGRLSPALAVEYRHDRHDPSACLARYFRAHQFGGLSDTNFVDGFRDSVGEILFEERLAEFLQTLVRIFRQFRIAGCEDHGHIRPFVFDRLDQLHARHARHRLIGYDKINIILAQDFECLLARIGLERRMPQVFQHRDGVEQHKRVVIDRKRGNRTRRVAVRSRFHIDDLRMRRTISSVTEARFRPWCLRLGCFST